MSLRARVPGPKPRTGPEPGPGPGSGPSARGSARLVCSRQSLRQQSLFLVFLERQLFSAADISHRLWSLSELASRYSLTAHTYPYLSGYSWFVVLLGGHCIRRGAAFGAICELMQCTVPEQKGRVWADKRR